MSTETELLAAINEIEKQVAPLRSKRDKIHAEIEKGRIEAKSISRQINEIERNSRVRRYELNLLLKEQGRVTSMKVEPARV